MLSAMDAGASADVGALLIAGDGEREA